MKSRILRISSVVAMLCGLLSTAHAGTAKAEVTGLRFELVDLDLNDGISPYFRETIADDDGIVSYDVNSLGDFGARFTAQTWQSNAGGVQQRRQHDFANGYLLASLESNIPHEQVFADAGFQVVVYGGRISCCNVALSPNTLLKVHGTGLVSATQGGSADVYYFANFDTLGSSSNIFYDNGALPREFDLSFTVRNDTDQTAWGEIGVIAETRLSASAVPEPTALTLGAIGIGCAMTARRKRIST